MTISHVAEAFPAVAVNTKLPSFKAVIVHISLLSPLVEIFTNELLSTDQVTFFDAVAVIVAASSIFKDKEDLSNEIESVSTLPDPELDLVYN